MACGTWSGGRRAPTGSKFKCPVLARATPRKREPSQDRLLSAEQQLQQTNSTSPKWLTPSNRKTATAVPNFAKLAGGSKTRLDLMNQMASVYDQIQAILKKPSAERDAIPCKVPSC